MMLCPSCQKPLARSATPGGLIYVCQACGGRCLTLPVLRKAGASEKFLATVWRQAITQSPGPARECPLCGRGMRVVRPEADGSPLTLDVCRLCPAVWFDPGEFDALPRRPPPSPPTDPQLTDEQREKLAIAKIQMETRQAREEDRAGGPEEAWQWIPGLLGLPVELDAPPVTHKPWVTWAVLLACTIASLPVLMGSRSQAQAIIQAWGLIPSQWLRDGGITLVTSFFLHAGLLHLVANMYFLYVFGDNVEERMGHLGYLLLISLGALCGDFAQGVLGANPNVPCVGASAGISAVIAFYAIAYPKVRLGILYRFGFFLYLGWLRLTAWSALVLYVLLQLLGVWMQARGFPGNVAHLAHLGGLGVGILAGLYYRYSLGAFREADQGFPVILNQEGNKAWPGRAE